VREGFERLAVSYLAGRAPLRLCVLILDARHEPTDRDETLAGWLEHHRLPWLVAANKVDTMAGARPGGAFSPSPPGWDGARGRCCR
jgi:GTP-binding protein